jgi:hypothetical protein
MLHELDAQQQRAVKKCADAPSTAAAILQTAEARRGGLDQMMWQVPALSLTAQSFLLTIALGPGTRWLGRGLAASLGAVAAAAAIQLLLKHRYGEERSSHWIENFLRDLDWPNLYSPQATEAYAYAGHEHEWARWRQEDISGADGSRNLRQRLRRRGFQARDILIRRRSPYVWISALSLFGIVDAAVVVLWVLHGIGVNVPLS